jgi:hypothetical protein
MRIWAQLSFGKARQVHAELGKLIYQGEDVRQGAAARAFR